MDKRGKPNFLSFSKMNPHPKIAQISDVHVGGGMDAAQVASALDHLRAVWKDVLSASPDLVVFSGDQTDHGSKEEIAAFLREVGNPGIPVRFLSGNHDDSRVLAEAVGAETENGKLVWETEFAGVRHIALDSSMNEVDEEQISRLRKSAESSGLPCALWIHHPPMLCGSAFMDGKHPLRNREPLLQALRELPRIRWIFCGHYHWAKSFEWEGKSVHLCPATQFQISETEPEFAVSENVPAWNLIEWRNGNARIETRRISP